MNWIVKKAGHFWLVCVLTGLSASVLCAKDVADDHVGGVIGEDVVTPVALDVVDPAATTALRATEALKTPAIFRDYTAVTNDLAGQLQLGFTSARSNFVNAIQETFHQATLNHADVTSPDFGYLVTAYNITHKNFPVPAALAMDWAYGETGDAEKNRLLDALLRAARHSIRPDDWPVGFKAGETVRLITVSHSDETLTPDEAETHGQIVAQTNFLTLAQAQMQFRREFNNFDEQPLARALSGYLQPNCLPDVALTQSVRDNAVQQLVVTEHYAAGQVIARQGSVIDDKIKAALDVLQGKSAVSAGGQPVSTVPANQLNEPPVAAITEASAPKDPPRAPTEIVTPSPLPGKISSYKNWLMAGLSAVAVLGLTGVWRFISQRRRAFLVSRTTKDLPWQTPTPLQTELAPQLVRIVREVFVQELAGQRQDLLLAQRNAAEEVIRLVHRMDEMQVVTQERLQTYESQIQELESELAVRTEENRELIKLKIQMTRLQLEAESGGKRVSFN